MGTRARSRRVRAAAEFDVARILNKAIEPRVVAGAYSWSLANIVEARNAQMRGTFRSAARLAESMRTDDALFPAFENRLAPLRCLRVKLVQRGKSSKAKAITGEAEGLFGQEGVGVTVETLADIQGCLVNHGVAFGVIDATLREDLSRVDYALRAWPIEHVRWDALKRSFVTFLDGGAEETITHGDGRWVVFAKNELEPYKHGALLSAALVWARHAFSVRDWARGSTSHGNAKVVGELPAGVALQKEDGTLTLEGAAFVELLKDIARSEAPAGIRPAGSKVDILANTSAQWQVWDALVKNAEQAAARIYLGTDGTLGSKGGAPGVDITALFGVASTLVEGDVTAIQKGILTGVIEPWAAINFGDSALAPARLYLLPDADAAAQRDEMAKRRQAFYDDIDRARASGFEIDQAFVDETAKLHGVTAPRLKSLATPAA